jgi:hypothetical protein
VEERFTLARCALDRREAADRCGLGWTSDPGTWLTIRVPGLGTQLTPLPRLRSRGLSGTAFEHLPQHGDFLADVFPELRRRAGDDLETVARQR